MTFQVWCYLIFGDISVLLTWASSKAWITSVWAQQPTKTSYSMKIENIQILFVRLVGIGKSGDRQQVIITFGWYALIVYDGRYSSRLITVVLPHSRFPLTYQSNKEKIGWLYIGVVGWGLFTYYISQKWGVQTPLPPLSAKNQKLAYPPSPPCQKKSETGLPPLPPCQKSDFDV